MSGKIFVTNSGGDTVSVIEPPANGVPVIESLGITPSTAKTNDVLTAQVVASDPDGDALATSYQWLRNGAVIPGAVSATLDLAVSGAGDEGDQVAVRVAVSDGRDRAEQTSSAIVIENSAPQASVSLQPTAPRKQDDIIATVAASDVDGDALGYRYVWSINGVIRATFDSLSSTSQFVLPKDVKAGDIISVTAVVEDEVAAASAEASVTVVRR